LRCRPDRSRRWLGERGDRIQQLAPVPDRVDADVLEVVRRQARQHRPIDGVRGESLYVLHQIQPTQPFGNIHGDARARLSRGSKLTPLAALVKGG